MLDVFIASTSQILDLNPVAFRAEGDVTCATLPGDKQEQVNVFKDCKGMVESSGHSLRPRPQPSRILIPRSKLNWQGF